VQQFEPTPRHRPATGIARLDVRKTGAFFARSGDIHSLDDDRDVRVLARALAA